eukprot:gene20227-26980_t
MSKTVFMRGLQNFISEIRACSTKEQETKRVDKELFKIREKFSDDRGLSGYDRRKYVWKLLYIYMLGYDIDFGHKQACDLIPMPKYKDKQVGYMACSLLLREDDDFLRLAINGIKSDLNSRNEAFECLALNFVGSVGGRDMVEPLTQDILKLLTNGSSRPLVKKRAALCLLKMMRKSPSDQPVVNPATFCSVLGGLLDEQDLGLLLSVMTLFHGILSRNGLVHKLVMRPSKVRLCGSLGDRSLALESLSQMARAMPNLAPPMRQHQSTINAALALALESLSRMARAMPDLVPPMRQHQSTISAALRELDVGVRCSALDLMYRTCDSSNVVEVVGELMNYMVAADQSMKDDIVAKVGNLAETFAPSVQCLGWQPGRFFVAKVGNLAEKFAPSVQWYIDLVLQLLERAGEMIHPDVWHRVVDLVRNNPPMQPYAARSVIAVIRRANPNENLVCTAAYLVGENGAQIKAETGPAEQFRILNGLFPPATQQTKGVLMAALMKIYLSEPQNPNLRRDMVGLFERYQQHMEPGLQQQSAEFLAVAEHPQAATMVFPLSMPQWPDLPAPRPQASSSSVSSMTRDIQPTTSFAYAAAAPGGLFSGPSSGMAPPAQPQAADLIAASSFPGGYPASYPAAAAVPPPQANQVDLLSDLLGDNLAVSAAAPAAPPPYSQPMPPPSYAQPPPQQQAYGAPPVVVYSPPAQQERFDPFAAAAAGAATGTAVGAIAASNHHQHQLQPYPLAPSHLAQQNSFDPFAAPAPAPAGAPPYYMPQHTAGSGAAYPPQAMAAAPPTPSYSAPTLSAADFSSPTRSVAPGAAVATTASVGGAAASNSDPFGDNAFAPPAPPPPPMPTLEPAVPTGDLEAWYKALLLKPRGVIYEDQYLQTSHNPLPT